MKRPLVVLGVAILMFFFGCQSSDKDENILLKEGFVELEEGIEIFYKTIGNGPETVIIPAGMYMDIEFQRLADEARTLVFYDMRGRGRSSTVTDPERIGMDIEISDLETLRQHLGKEKVSLIGWSYLGAMVTLYTVKYPNRVNRVIQVGPLPPTKDIFAKAISTPMDSESQALIKKMKDEGLDKSDPECFCHEYWNIYMKRIFYNPEKLSWFQSNKCKCKNELPDNVHFHLSTMIKSLGNWDWRENLRNVDTHGSSRGTKNSFRASLGVLQDALTFTHGQARGPLPFGSVEVPALTIQGEHDPSCPLEGARTWAAWLRNARLLIIPEAGHMPFVEDPDLFYASVDTFLNGEWPARTEVLGVPVYAK